jgi:hypothetical protein
MPPVHDRAKKRAAEKGMDLQEFVNESVLLNIERDDFLKAYRPNYVYSVTPQGIFIADKADPNQRESAQVVIENGTLVCWLDHSDDCKHVHFAAAVPEVVKLGLKRPKVSD